MGTSPTIDEILHAVSLMQDMVKSSVKLAKGALHDVSSHMTDLILTSRCLRISAVRKRISRRSCHGTRFHDLNAKKAASAAAVAALASAESA